MPNILWTKTYQSSETLLSANLISFVGWGAASTDLKPPKSWQGRGQCLSPSASWCTSTSPLSTSSNAWKCTNIAWWERLISLWKYPCKVCVRLYGPGLHPGSTASLVPSPLCTPSADPHAKELLQRCLYRASGHIHPRWRTSWPFRWHSWMSHPTYPDLLAQL